METSWQVHGFSAIRNRQCKDLQNPEEIVIRTPPPPNNIQQKESTDGMGDSSAGLSQVSV